jgi:hypothetical protein
LEFLEVVAGNRSPWFSFEEISNEIGCFERFPCRLKVVVELRLEFEEFPFSSKIELYCWSLAYFAAVV